MRSAVEKSSNETRSRAAAGRASERKGRGTGTFHVADNGAVAIQRRKLEQTAHNSPQARQAAQLRTVIDTSTRMVTQRQQFERISGAAQRQAIPDEEELQMKTKAAIQTRGLDEEELLQGKFPATETPVQLKGDPNGPDNRTGLPDHVKTGIESLSGMSMDDVKVHYNSARPAELQALAYTQGTDIHVGPGQEQHLPHEAWHVVQQKEGRVAPTMQLKGVDVNADPALEREADTMGAKAARRQAHADPKAGQE